MGATSTPICIGVTKAGGACRNPVLPGSEFCWWHDPTKAQDRKAACIKGGKARHGRRVGTTGSGARVEINSLSDVIELLTSEINELLTLEKSISRARAVGYLAGIAANIYQASELEARIVALERQIK